MKRIVMWGLSVVLAMLFVLSGSSKLLMPALAHKNFAHWGYPAWFVTVIGVSELLGAVGLLVPKVARWATLGLSGIMIGALYTHLSHMEWIMAILPGVVLLILGAIYKLRTKP